MIDITKAVHFYDDTGKTKLPHWLQHVLFLNANVCLCLTRDATVGEVLFDIKTGAVLTENLRFWYATNAKPY